MAQVHQQAQVQQQVDQHVPADLLTCKYRVDNWQIPVPIGDASAHFLVEVIDQNPRVITAFFMDGGDNAQHHGGDDTAYGKIAEALPVMDRKYGTQWTFDAIVTTHHDKDHYRGLEELLPSTLPVQTARGNHHGGTYRDAYFSNNLTYYRGNNDDPFVKWQPSACTAVIAGENAIGVDIFSRTRMFLRHGLVDLADLNSHDHGKGIKLFTNGPHQLRRPRFAVVGANGFGVHTQSPDQITPGTPTENQKSLLAVVYWPANGRTSYFTGGDGNPKVELEGVVPWMEQNRDLKNNYPQLPVAMVKLDHHGSLKETLTDNNIKNCHSTILTKMEASNILVTPGNKHGHPNWVVMELVMRHLDTLQGGGRLYTTRSPYWLSKKNANMLDTNTNHAGMKKTKHVFVQKGKGFDDADQEDDEDGLFRNEMRSWSNDNNATKAEYEESANKLRGPNGETLNRRTINKIHKQEDRKLITRLRKNKVVLKSRPRTAAEEEEPPLNNRQILKYKGQENRENIRWHTREKTWNLICDQEICDYGSPYFLIHFSFEDGQEPVVDFSMDETGQQKMTQAAIQAAANSTVSLPVIDDGEERVYYDGEESVHVATRDPNKALPDGQFATTRLDEYKHAEGMGSHRERMAYVQHQMQPNNFKLAEYMTGINLVGEMQANLWGKYNKLLADAPDSPIANALHPALGSGRQKSAASALSPLAQMTLPYQGSDIAPGNLLRPTKLKGQVIRDWTNASNPGKTAKFGGKVSELRDFKAFVSKYCNDKAFADQTDRDGPLFITRGKKKLTNEQQETLLKMFDQWIALQDLEYEGAKDQYREHLQSQFGPLKKERMRQVEGTEDYVMTMKTKRGKEVPLNEKRTALGDLPSTSQDESVSIPEVASSGRGRPKREQVLPTQAPRRDATSDRKVVRKNDGEATATKKK